MSRWLAPQFDLALVLSGEETMTAVITGAGKGIGRAVALRLARDHDALVLMDVDAQALSLVSKEFPASVTVRRVVGSVASSSDCVRAAEAAAELGGADVL